jgi:hypothetical protein
VADGGTTYDSIKKDVDAAGGVRTFCMADLRDAQAAGRLSPGINAKISRALASRGLGHVPLDPAGLSTSQWDEVRVFDRTTALGEVIIAAHTAGDDADAVLREAVNGDARALLERVRDLVCQA